MMIEVVSVHAALAGRERITWYGDVDLPAGGPEVVNDWLFRYFNRVDERDVARLAIRNYELPSLSVGDLLTWDSKTYRVAGEGFELVTESAEFAMTLMLYAMASSRPDALVRRVLEAARDVGLLYAISKGDELNDASVEAVTRELEAHGNVREAAS